jgi:hypothetical protein
VTAGAGELPDPQLTPGAINSAISQEQYRTVCNTKNWTRSYRSPVSFTNSAKEAADGKYGYSRDDFDNYEEDHLVPLCLAGSPQDPATLWPQPRFSEWSADRKNALEAKLCKLACDGKVQLDEAQREIAADWIAAYKKYISAQKRP